MNKRRKYIKITESIIPDIRYEGLVTIKYQTNNRYKTIRRKNEGLTGLFDCLSRALALQDISRIVPSSIMGYDSSENQVFSQRIPYTTTPTLYNNDSRVTGNTSNTVEFIFIVPVNNIIQTSTLTKLTLFNNNNAECATVTVSPGIDLSTDTNLLINWKLKFSN